MRRIRRSNLRRAVFLIMALWIAIILGMMALSISSELAVNMRLTRFTIDRQRAEALARLGLARGVADLRNDRLMAMADPAEWAGDTLHDTWADEEGKIDVEIKGRRRGEEGSASYSVRVTDEERKINVTMLGPQNAGVLAKLLEELGDLDPFAAQNVALMIVDFQDPDNIPSSGQGSNEREFWTEWGAKELADSLPPDWRFIPKNDRMATADELLQIPGITPTLLYGDPAEEKTSRRRARDRRRQDNEESRRLADYITFTSAGFVNINTASELVLEAVVSAAMGENPAAGGIAKQIIEYRESEKDKKSTTIMNAQQMMQQAGVPPNEAGLISQAIGLGTAANFFTIDATGKSRGVTRRLRWIVRVDIDPFPAPPGRDLEGRRDPEARGALSNRPEAVADPAVRVVETYDY